MTTITRSDILGTIGKRRIAKEEIDGIGVAYVRSITEGERAAIEDATRQDPKRARVLLIVSSLCDEEGTPLLGKNDIDALMEADSRVTMALSNAIARHIQPTDYEGTRKNLQETQGDDSQ